MNAEQLREQYEKDAGERHWVNPVCHGEIAFASHKYQLWLEGHILATQDTGVDGYTTPPSQFFGPTVEMGKREAFRAAYHFGILDASAELEGNGEPMGEDGWWAKWIATHPTPPSEMGEAEIESILCGLFDPSSRGEIEWDEYKEIVRAVLKAKEGR